MKKRLREKQGAKYNLLKYVRRQLNNRKGELKYIDYKLISIGENDKLDFIKEGYAFDFPYTTHWFIEFFQHILLRYFVIQIYPSTSKGRISQRNSYIRVLSAEKEKRDDIFLVYEKIVNDMMNDQYMKKHFTYEYDDLLWFITYYLQACVNPWRDCALFYGMIKRTRQNSESSYET